MYAAGQGAQRDLLEAYSWLARAAGGGVVGAAAYLKRVSARMDAQQLEMVQGLSQEAA